MAKTNKEFITGLYQLLWGQQPSQANVDLYAARLDSGLLTRAGVEYTFFTAPEYSQKAEQLARLYLAVFNRIPDLDGFLFWAGVQRNGGSNTQIGETFARSDEFVAKYGGNLTNVQYLDLIYQNVLGRPADVAGRDFWAQQMAAGMSRGEIVNQFAQSQEFAASSAIEVNASLIYTTMVGRMPTTTEVTAAPSSIEQLIVKASQASDVPVIAGSISYSDSLFSESQLNDGSIVNSITLTLTGDTFKGGVGSTFGKIANVPKGLTGVLTKTSDTTAVLALTGAAASNASANNVSNLTVTLDNTVFTGGKAANVTGATKSDLQIGFLDIPMKELNHLLSGVGALTSPMAVDLSTDQLLLGGKSISLLSGSMPQVNNVDFSGIAAATTSTSTTTTSSKVTVTTSLKGDDGDNLLIGSAYPNVFEGGKGNDTMQGGASVDKFIFGITPSLNGNDTINGFTIGKGGDVLNFSAFLNKTGVTKIGTVNAASIVPKAWSNGDVLAVQGNSLDAASIADLFGAAKAFAAPTVASKMVVITADIIGDASIWFVINQNDVTAITPDEITLVGTLKNVNNLGLVGFDASNFA
ncbi:MAG: DUF4214 domain-containing protein [Burkholderiales bacterium]|nr:DUF4214 domain-containing protein [Burkholderiales bacterium]